MTGETLAEVFCERYGVEIECTPIHERPDGIGNDWGGQNYQVEIARPNVSKSMNLYFTDSIYHKQVGLTPSYYDILASIEKYDPCEDVWDFASEYGYQITCKDEYEKVNKIHDACIKEYQAVADLFEDCMDDLMEIS